MKRRDFLKVSGGLYAQMVLGGTVVSSFNARRAEAATNLPLLALTSVLHPADATVVLPNDPHYNALNVSFNQRTQLAPRVRIVAQSANGVQVALRWAIENGIPFAVRAGGHSYEGFSQSRQMVLDVRELNSINVDDVAGRVTIGAGVALGQVYQALSPFKLAIPAGSCFTVGAAGHSLGGGYGLLGRPFGLACDNLESLQMVDASGQLRTVNASADQDLFWALRGGGNGNFGVVTQLEFRTHPVDKVAVFHLAWQVPLTRAISIVQAWQQWQLQVADGLSCTFHLSKARGGLLAVELSGQSTQSVSEVALELSRLQKVTGPASGHSLRPMDFILAAQHFNGTTTYPSVLMKAKSDYVSTPLSAAGIRTLLQGLLSAPGPIGVLADTYGGAINRIPRTASAFVHRGSTMYSLQYFMQWYDPKQSAANIAMLQSLYASMRPFVSGECYVNYCDLDIEDYAKAYWAENLPRLVALKNQYDPHNVFQHAQSVPLKLA